jgi:pSer/pThr/pTyr-binding forkhead associated (FHA) protein
MPRLVIRKGEGVGKDHALGGECVVGRHPTCTFPLDDVLASRRHFRVLQKEGAWWAEDLGSTNGTLVNGRKITQHRLADGDVLSAGNTEMVFVQKDLLATGAPAAARPPEKVGALPPVAVKLPPVVAAESRPTLATRPAAPSPVPAPPRAPAAPPASQPSGPAATKPPPAPSPAPKKFEAPVPRKKRPGER